jgi:hypothetical protein
MQQQPAMFSNAHSLSLERITVRKSKPITETQCSGATTKNRFTAKGAKAAKEKQNPNHKGTRRDTQGHKEKKQRDSSRGNKIFKVSNAETAVGEWDFKPI